LGRTGEHRNAMLANLVCSLIKHKRVTTSLAKAKAARSVAEKMVTLGKSGTLHDRRLAVARLHQEEAVKTLFTEIVPANKERRGGYTRIVKLGTRQGDAGQKAILEWVGVSVAEVPAATKPAKEAKPAEGKPSETKAVEAKPAETEPAEAKAADAKAEEKPAK
jgi:large subunit ribosomal protein L17